MKLMITVALLIYGSFAQQCMRHRLAIDIDIVKSSLVLDALPDLVDLLDRTLAQWSLSNSAQRLLELLD